MQPNAKANTVRKLFSRETSVRIKIKADTKAIWDLLTNAGEFPRWNSTVISLDGRIAPGEKILLTSSLDPKRVFKLSIKEFEPEKRMAWGDGMGNRIYRIQPNPDGTATFSMIEKIGGPIFPLFAWMIPSFEESFEQFAIDLRNEAERKTRSN